MKTRPLISKALLLCFVLCQRVLNLKVLSRVFIAGRNLKYMGQIILVREIRLGFHLYLAD